MEKIETSALKGILSKLSRQEGDIVLELDKREIISKVKLLMEDAVKT